MPRVSQLWQAFLAALCFLSIFPVPGDWLKNQSEPVVQGYSLLFYPLVGLLFGLVLAASIFFFSVFDSLLSSALLVTLWVALTGALHLDGLGDTADAWLGGHGDPQKTLAILKDTHAGIGAVVSIVLVLLLKVVAIHEIDKTLFLAVFIAPFLSRGAVILLFLTTDYVRENGLGSMMVNAIPRQAAWGVIGLLIILTAVVLQWIAIFVLVSVALCFFLYQVMLIRRIGGTTGDTAGAMVEIIEVVILLDFAALEFLSR